MGRIEGRTSTSYTHHDDEPPNYCVICGAEVWPLKGTDVLTCRRGHHQPNYWKPTV